MAVLLAAVVCLPAVAGMQMPKPKQEPFFIGVAGGTASGKTSVVDKVVKALQHESVVSITMDCFYRDLTDAERDRAHACDFDFDHPNAVRHGRHLNPELTDLQPRLILAACPLLIPPRPLSVRLRPLAHGDRPAEERRQPARGRADLRLRHALAPQRRARHAHQPAADRHHRRHPRALTLTLILQP